MASNGEAEQHGSGQNLVRRLPDDVLADVLGLLAPRWLATSRCVCKAWHDVVDARRLLRADLLPLSLDGIIIRYTQHVYWEFFSRPTTRKGHPLSVKSEYLLTVDPSKAIDHCNGLLLLRDYRRKGTAEYYVANPATGWAAPLPPCPSMCSATEGDYYYNNYLVFDPFVSSHYEVFSVPPLSLGRLKPEEPSTLIICVFSSLSQRWEERSFSREGEPSGATTVIPSFFQQPCAVYWRGSLYIRCENNVVMRLSSSKSKFWVIEPPEGITDNAFVERHLGRSEKGVYFASLHNFRLSVWILDESCGHLKWILRHDNNLRPMLPTGDDNQHDHGPWTLQDINYRSGVLDDYVDADEEPLSRQKFSWNSAPSDDKFEWNSDDDDALEDREMIKVGYVECMDILGFHPYKEIVFFSQSVEIGLAYYLESSRVQVLGKLYPTRYDEFLLATCKEILTSFPYTPCLIEMCPRQN